MEGIGRGCGPDLGWRLLNWECREWGSMAQSRSSGPSTSSTQTEWDRVAEHRGRCQTFSDTKAGSFGKVVRTLGVVGARVVALLSACTPTMSAVSPFTAANRFYVKSLYRRKLKNALDWTIRRDLWRPQALLIRAEFERNRCVPISPPLSPIDASQQCERSTSARPHFCQGRG